MQPPDGPTKQSGFSRWLRSGSFIERWFKESVVTLPFAAPLAYVVLLLKGRSLEFSYVNFAIGTAAVTLIVGFNATRASMKRYPEVKIDPEIARRTLPIEPK
jgi:hypothetical protein